MKRLGRWPVEEITLFDGVEGNRRTCTRTVYQDKDGIRVVSWMHGYRPLNESGQLVINARSIRMHTAEEIFGKVKGGTIIPL